MSNGTMFLSKSTTVTNETVVFEEDGQEYLQIKLRFLTLVTLTTGKNCRYRSRIDKFNKRFGKRTGAAAASAAVETTEEKEA
jgi:hypothetical protein